MRAGVLIAIQHSINVCVFVSLVQECVLYIRAGCIASVVGVGVVSVLAMQSMLSLVKLGDD